MLKMKKWKKVLIIIMLVFGIIVGIYGLVYKLTVKQIETQESPLYQYTFQPAINYKVHLIENDLYDTTFQGEGENYFRSLLNYIEINFNTIYQATKEAQLDMDYTVVASVIGYSINSDIRTDYWKKDFALSEQKHDSIKSDYIQKEETIQLYLDQYEKFISSVNEKTGINLTTELVISMTGRINANSPEGNLVTPFEIKLKMPLNNSIFTITEEGNEVITDQLTEKIEYELPVNTLEITLISIGITLGVILFVLMLVIVKEPLKEDLLLLKIKKIIKNYGSRMVALKYLPDKTFTHIYLVNSIKDLLVTSDEIHIPIYYITDENEVVKDSTFYCELNDNLYLYREEISNDDSNLPTENINQNGKLELQEEII